MPLHVSRLRIWSVSLDTGETVRHVPNAYLRVGSILAAKHSLLPVRGFSLRGDWRLKTVP